MTRSVVKNHATLEEALKVIANKVNIPADNFGFAFDLFRKSEYSYEFKTNVPDSDIYHFTVPDRAWSVIDNYTGLYLSAAQRREWLTELGGLPFGLDDLINWLNQKRDELVDFQYKSQLIAAVIRYAVNHENNETNRLKIMESTDNYSVSRLIETPSLENYVEAFRYLRSTDIKMEINYRNHNILVNSTPNKIMAKAVMVEFIYWLSLQDELIDINPIINIAEHYNLVPLAEFFRDYETYRRNGDN